jgi:hypothetical protein
MAAGEAFAHVLAALREKFAGLKQKISCVIVIAASATASGYDFLTAIVGSVDVTSLAARVPSWSWPLILISITALFQFLRNLADKRHQAELLAADLAAKEIETEIDARKQASAVIIAEQGRWYTAIIRPLLAFPLINYL